MTNAADPLSEQYALDLDVVDFLRNFHIHFHIPEGTGYLDGNSLGPLSRDAERAVLAALESWKVQGIVGWLATDPPWFTLGEDLGARMAALVGAAPDQGPDRPQGDRVQRAPGAAAVGDRADAGLAQPVPTVDDPL